MVTNSLSRLPAAALFCARECIPSPPRSGGTDGPAIEVPHALREDNRSGARLSRTLYA
jgi:hypothetical protein